MKRMLAATLACLGISATAAPISAAVEAPLGDDAAAQTTAYANPMISRNVPAFSDSGTASAANDEHYYTAWQTGAPAYLAYDLSGVAESQRQQVIAVWYNDSTYDNLGSYVSKNEEPIDYVIEINAAEGGSCPEEGWETAVTVSGNGLSSRQHLVDLQGYNWIRLRVLSAKGDRVKLNFDVHDASGGVHDSWIFLGDSITAGGMVISWGTSYAVQINRLDPRYLPIAQNGGIGGITSTHGKESIDEWLKDTPVKYVSIAFGTNDCWGNPDRADIFYENTKYMIDAILDAGKVPVLPMIPWSTNEAVGDNVGFYNAKITKLYEEYGTKLVHGPDFDSFFKENPQYLSSDGVHPSSDGYEAMRKLWAETMYAEVYSKTPDSPEPLMGDINTDGSVTKEDAVLLERYLTTRGELDAKQASLADMDADQTLDAVDLTLLKRKILTESADQAE